MPMKLRQLWIQVTADRRKFGALCVVFMVAMLLWGRLIVVSRMPRTALATDAAAAQAVPTKVPSANSPSVSTTPLHIDLATDPARDPFVISPRYFPRTTSFTDLTHAAGKSPTKAVEEGAELEARITAQFQALVQRLRLEAVVNGAIAVIDGRTYRVGDVVTSVASTTPSSNDLSGRQPVEFRLVEVGQRTATLEYEGRRFELRMAGP